MSGFCVAFGWDGGLVSLSSGQGRFVLIPTNWCYGLFFREWEGGKVPGLRIVLLGWEVDWIGWRRKGGRMDGWRLCCVC